ncbi:MAG TPA: hypothetical protein VHP55_11975 [Usitatibacter sp.]|jgi:ElaB/YqjD/DUF883 family membrane-anchored ribosome-binding protein|nr:hypothetical protein [Usitatibacter sp.]
MAFGDWSTIIRLRHENEVLVRSGVTGADDMLDMPPAPGTERTWLQALLDDAKRELDRAKEWATSPVQETKRRASEVAQRVRDMMSHAGEAAKQYAQELEPKVEQLAKDAGIVITGLSLAVTSPFWLPFLLWLLYEVFFARRSGR